MVDWTGKHIGKYQVKKLLGQGGMGQVYQAFHSALERDVALKVIHTRLARDPEAIERFRREAKVVASLRHPGIIHVYDFEVEGDAFYMVMEFVPGHDLHERLATLHQWDERLPLNEALRLFKSITEAVAYAHSQEVIHRDLKPSNVLLTADDRPILVDFGLSKLIGADQLTIQGMIMGTPQYMSPEQGTGGVVDARSDVYSLGVILYELATGTRPFTSATPVGLILKHVSEPPAPPRSINPNLPETVEQVIQKALAKDPADRYGSAQELLRAVEALLSPLAGDQAETIISFVDDGRCPYRGLQTFEAEHAEFFFGREALINQLVKQVAALSQARSDLSDARFLAVLGASGSGKSSLVRAGLVPALQRQPRAQWVPLVLKPGSRPLEELAAQLATLEAQATDRLATTRRLLNHLSADGRALHLALRLAWAEAPAGQQLLLVVDQFEETFTLCRDETERQRFIENLLYAAASQEGRIFVLLTMRADFYHRCAAYRELAGRMAGQQVLVGPMDEVELRRAIERPAETVGLRFEPGLVDTILAEVNQQPGALPLLEHALLELWERRERGLLSLAAYRDSGGVIGAIAQRAETLYNSFNPEEQAIVRQVMLRLTQPGEGTEDTRRRARLSEFGVKSSTTRVIQRLTQARLLTLSRDAASGEEMVDVAHEALIRGWERLRTWIDEDRAALRTHRRLTEAAEEWERHRRDESYLYQGARLAEAEEWLKTHTEEANDLERAFVQASVEAREAAARAAQRARRRVVGGLVAGLAVVSLLLIVSLILGGAATVQWRRADSSRATAEAHRLEAERQHNISQAREIVGEAQRHLDQNPQLAALLALAAKDFSPIYQAQDLLEEVPFLYPPLVASLTGNNSNFNQVTFSPDGAYLASSSYYSSDGTYSASSTSITIALWNTSAWHDSGRFTDQPVITLKGFTAPVNDIAFSPDGTLLASGSGDGTILWNVTTGQSVTTLVRGITSVAFSPDGSLLASGLGDNTISLGNVTTGQPVTTLKGHTDLVEDLAFSPSGELLASASRDNTIIFWDVTTGQSVATLKAHTSYVGDLAFSPSGDLLASGSGDTTIILWDVATGQPMTTLKEHTGPIYSLAFSPDGTRLASGSGNFQDSIILWDLSTGRDPVVASAQPVTRLNGGGGRLAFSPDGALLASGSGVVSLWDLAGKPLVTTLEAHTDPVRSVAFSPDNTLLASGAEDSTVILWDVATSQPVTTLKGHTSQVNSVAFSPDGVLLASGSGDKTVILWNVATGQPAVTLKGHTDSVASVAFSPDGALLASGSTDKTVILWDVATGQPAATLKSHTNLVISVAFSPDGALLASGSLEDGIMLWDVATGQSTTTLKGHTDWVGSLAFSPDGKRLASRGMDGTVILWNLASGQPSATFEAGYTLSSIHSNVVFSPDSASLASTWDSEIVIWDVAIGQVLTTINKHEGDAINSLAFSPDGTLLALGSRDRKVIILDAKFTRHPCHWLTRNLNHNEWNVFVSSDLPYRELCPGLPVPGGN